MCACNEKRIDQKMRKLVKSKKDKKGKKKRNFSKNRVNTSRYLRGSSEESESENEQEEYCIDSDEEDERQLKDEIMEEIEDFLSYRPDFTVIEFTDEWIILAKFKKLRINTIANATGFQPVENNKESNECLVRLVLFGEEPPRGYLAYHLKKGGCPTIIIRAKHDVNFKLDSI